MSAATEQLLADAFGDPRHPLALWLRAEIERGQALADFVAAHARKLRKKVRLAADAEALRDLRCELAVAAALADRRSPLVYEPPADGGRGPDFMLRHKGHTPVAVEVTRLRAPRQRAGDPAGRLAATICGKLGQLGAGHANLLVVVSDDEPLGEAERPALLAGLRRRAEAGDDAFFAYRGLDGARAARRQLAHLSALLLADPAPPALALLPGPTAARALPADLARAAAGWRLAELVGPPERAPG